MIFIKCVFLLGYLLSEQKAFQFLKSPKIWGFPAKIT